MSKAVLWIRRVVAAVVFVGFVALFANFGMRELGFLAKLQFWPAVLAGSAIVAGAIVIVTMLAGRWYCSVCCPLGIMQDLAFCLMRHKAQGNRFATLRRVVRIVALVAFVGVGFAGLGFSWIEPYGLFGRIATNLSIGLTLGILIAVLAVWKGRVWCNWVCPVGTILGALSRFAPLRLKIDSSKCVGCKKCERACRASAIEINGKGGKIDATLCVQCRDCTALCPQGATRRSFIAGAAAVGAVAVADAADEKTVDGGLAEVSEPGVDVRNASLKPAGSLSIGNFQTKCVGCQLCVKECPNHVLRPSKRLKDFMQPEMAFDKGYCTVDCTRCGQVCPAGAITEILPDMKTNIHIGEATWHGDRCIAATEGVNCTACFRHCPVKAIVRTKGSNGAMIPVVDADKCIGCGACEHVCPARPMPAMTVKAYEQHRDTQHH